jgi:uroporphyrinogen decarboxylase
MQACLRNEASLDRPPVALWRHFPVDDQSPGSLAEATLDFQDHYDFDLAKVTPASSFCIKDWGAEDTWEGNTEGTRRYTKRVIQEPRDWERLEVLDPKKASHLSAQLKCLKMIRKDLEPETPLLQTIFSPLAQAKNLVGGETLIAHLHRYPGAVARGLSTIALTTERFIEACLKTHIDGIFYAVQHAQAGLLTEEEYREFGLRQDQVVLEPARELWCNILHLHGLEVYFNLVPEYGKLFDWPLIVNWHDRETPPILKEARSQLGPEARVVFCGGISQHSIVYADTAQVRQEAEDALAQTGGRRFLLGTGCVTPVIAPHGNLLASRQAVETTKVVTTTGNKDE